MHVTAAFAPAAREREWLRALAHAGVRVSWSGDSLPATAIEVAERSDPAGGVRAYVAAPAGTRATLSRRGGPHRHRRRSRRARTRSRCR